MALSCFADKASPPSDAALRVALGATADLWQELIGRMGRRFSPLDQTWGFSSKSTGWGLRLKHRDRTVLYMTPCRGHFLASFALGERAVKLAHESDLPPAALEVIDRAPRYAEGRGVRFEVRDARDLSNIETIAALKMAH